VGVDARAYGKIFRVEFDIVFVVNITTPLLAGKVIEKIRKNELALAANSINHWDDAQPNRVRRIFAGLVEVDDVEWIRLAAAYLAVSGGRQPHGIQSLFGMAKKLIVQLNLLNIRLLDDSQSGPRLDETPVWRPDCPFYS
jgi:hypothetical protein